MAACRETQLQGGPSYLEASGGWGVSVLLLHGQS